MFNIGGDLYQTAVWVGEYNHFGGPEESDAWMRRYAALDDRYLQAGGAWWQWEQECGDPHSVQYPPTPEWIEEQQAKCGDARFRVRECLNRGYPRAVPGRLTELNAEPCDGDLFVAGRAADFGTADLWFPLDDDEPPTVTGSGITAVIPTRVPGGWRLDVSVHGDYEINVSPAPSA
ncbi:MAG: hypothetical protein M5R36_14520 [Deltaproteobacteria bacterium]|nr:hypothetical protein [Deltaproteobacteria bacterium]